MDLEWYTAGVFYLLIKLVNYIYVQVAKGNVKILTFRQIKWLGRVSWPLIMDLCPSLYFFSSVLSHNGITLPYIYSLHCCPTKTTRDVSLIVTGVRTYAHTHKFLDTFTSCCLLKANIIVYLQGSVTRENFASSWNNITITFFLFIYNRLRSLSE